MADITETAVIDEHGTNEVGEPVRWAAGTFPITMSTVDAGPAAMAAWLADHLEAAAVLGLELIPGTRYTCTVRRPVRTLGGTSNELHESAPVEVEEGGELNY